MRPRGEISKAILASVEALATHDRGPTVAEIAAHALVGRAAALMTLKNLKRHGHLRIARTRRVDYRTRPVAEYDLPEPAEPAPNVGLQLSGIFSTWRSAEGGLNS